MAPITFHRFTELSVELQMEIWEQAIDDAAD